MCTLTKQYCGGINHFQCLLYFLILVLIIKLIVLRWRRCVKQMQAFISGVCFFLTICFGRRIVLFPITCLSIIGYKHTEVTLYVVHTKDWMTKSPRQKIIKRRLETIQFYNLGHCFSHITVTNVPFCALFFPPGCPSLFHKSGFRSVFALPILEFNLTKHKCSS